jgi:predicted Zn-dependent peptidase
MNAVIGGAFESRLNLNLREDKSWSYGYRSNISRNASGAMTFSTTGQVQTDKTAESMQEILKELVAFSSDSPATVTEVERLKLNRSRSIPGSYSTNGGFLSAIVASDSYGLPYDYAETAFDRIAAVTTPGVAKRATDVIDASKLTWIVVGDLAQIEDKVRALEYGPVEVWDAFGNRIR